MGALRYPAKDDALAHPELLERLPARWRACRQAVAAVGLLAAVSAVAGCDGSPGESARPTPGIVAVSPLSTDIPLYIGEPAPPPVLGEAEAMVVIERIMKEYLPDIARNVDVNSSNKSVVYFSNEYSCDNTKYEHVISVTAGAIDLYDEKACIGLEYIGADDRLECVLQEGAAKPEQSKPNVLVVNGIYEGTAESDIRAMIVDFLTWLKAEGIG